MPDTPSPPPSADELAWVDYLLSTAVGDLTEIVESLERECKRDDDRGAFEGLSLERLGGFLLLSRCATATGETLVEQAGELARLAASLYNASEDTNAGVVCGVAGVESYERYRSRIAARYAEAAKDASSR